MTGQQPSGLDPEFQELLTRTAVALPPLRSVSPAESRARHRAAALAGRGPHDVPEAVAAVETLYAPGTAGELEVRLYRPSLDAGPLPVVVYLHGGGWVLGDLDGQDPTCRTLANVTGAAVASVDYRLAPEHPYPAALDDACAVVRWLHGEGAVRGLDPDCIAIAGSSAGANVAAATTLRLRDEGEPLLSAQLLLYPPTDPLLTAPSVEENAEGYFLTADDMRWFVDAYLPDPATRTSPYAGPLHADSLEGLPPAVVTTAGFDPLRDEGIAYAERLRADRVPVTHLHFPSLIHGYFGFTERVHAAAWARDEVLAAFAAVLAQ